MVVVSQRLINLNPTTVMVVLLLGWLKICVRSTHVVEQLSFSMLPSILIFDFDLILGSFGLFGALMGFFGVGIGFKNCFGVS